MYAKHLTFGLGSIYFILQYENLHETNVAGSELMLGTFKLRVTILIIMNSKIKIPKLYYLGYVYLHRKKPFLFFFFVFFFLHFLLIMRENYLKFISIRKCYNESVNKN